MARLSLKNTLVFFSLILVCIVFSALTFKGGKSLDYYGKTLSAQVGGPFESSNSNARYALTKSIVDNKSLFFDLPLARFSAPDITYYNGKYTSVFTPGVSMLAVPFYMLGAEFGLEQVFAYSMNIVFSVVSVLLVAAITKKVTKSTFSGGLSGLIFLFGTNALAYSQTMTQHMISTTVVLIFVWTALYMRGIARYLLAGGLLGIGTLVDIPNAIIALPSLVLIGSEVIKHSAVKEKISINIDLKAILFWVALTPFVLMFGYYNYNTNGSPVKLAQFIGRTENVVEDTVVKPAEAVETNSEDHGIEFPFYTRLMSDGMYILLVSDERGIFYYSPIMLLGIAGIIIAYRSTRSRKFTVLSLATILISVLTYSMFGDPWGGWSFGARYMIPVYALLSIFVGITISRMSRKLIFSLIFVPLLGYSIVVNSFGALTSIAVPPKGEAQSLPDPVAYTYEYNLDRINNNLSELYVYNSKLSSQITLKDYNIGIVIAESIILVSFYVASILESRKVRS